ncbi:MAG TPA: ATP-binding protein [Sphingomonas sp.]
MILWPRSLIARILILELGAIAVAALLLPVIMISLLHSEVDRYQRRTLTGQAQAIARSVAIATPETGVKLDPGLANAYATPYDGRAYVISDRSRRILAGSAYSELVPWRSAPLGQTMQAFRTGDFNGVSLPARFGANPAWIIVTQNEGGPGAILDDVVRSFVARFDPVLVLILLLLPLINSVLIGRVVLAVRAASRRAEAIGPRTLDVRLEEAGLPREVAPLAHATNQLLMRLQTSFRQQSEFVANVAHELRTPLAIHRVELEAVDDAALRARLSASADRLTHVITQLQDLAALETIADTPFERFDAREMARDTTQQLAPQILAAGDTVALEVPDEPVMLAVNRTLVTLALTNLVSNATRHTPTGTSIAITVFASGSIEVRDDGPGIAASTPELSLQRYWRADHQRSDTAGLGLSIVNRIMEVHGGRLEVLSQSGAGTRCILHFSNRA